MTVVQTFTARIKIYPQPEPETRQITFQAESWAEAVQILRNQMLGHGEEVLSIETNGEMYERQDL